MYFHAKNSPIFIGWQNWVRVFKPQCCLRNGQTEIKADSDQNRKTDFAQTAGWIWRHPIVYGFSQKENLFAFLLLQPYFAAAGYAENSGDHRKNTKNRKPKEVIEETPHELIEHEISELKDQRNRCFLKTTITNVILQVQMKFRTYSEK